MKSRYIVSSLSLVCSLSLGLGVFRAQAQSISAATVSYTGVFTLDHGIAAYDADARTLDLLNRSGSALDRKGTISVAGQVGAVAETSLGLAVATGQGRGDLNAPIRVTLYDKESQPAGIVFEQSGERSQVSYLKWLDGKLWITFFASKYITKTGYFTPSAKFPWTFSQVHSLRLGDATDVSANSVVIGRPYGDVQGQDGDAVLIAGKEVVDLPSYRGVRSVLLLPGRGSEEIAIGDGWHQNYAQSGQARLSWLKKDAESGRYALQIIDRDASQYNFSKLSTVTVGGAMFIAALGNKQLALYGPRPGWEKRVVYSRQKEESYFDFARLEEDASGAWFVVLDEGLRVVRVDVTKGKLKP